MRTSQAATAVTGQLQLAPPSSALRRGSAYAQLSRQIKEAGLLERRRGYYAWKIAATAAALAAGWTVFAMVGNSWRQLAVAAFLAVAFPQIGFLGHDAGHRQNSGSRKLAGLGRTAGTSLDAAARFLARGAPGVWPRAVSRVGLVCRGTVYLLLLAGCLALRLALAAHGRSGAPASSAGAVQAVTKPSWGRVLLVLLVAGLGAYALIQLIEAVFRPSHAATTIGRWRQRAVSSWGCLLYVAFCLSTYRQRSRPSASHGRAVPLAQRPEV